MVKNTICRLHRTVRGTENQLRSGEPQKKREAQFSSNQHFPPNHYSNLGYLENSREAKLLLEAEKESDYVVKEGTFGLCSKIREAHEAKKWERRTALQQNTHVQAQRSQSPQVPGTK